MKFEKVSDNKIRIILTSEDLDKEHIDFHSFMSNSVESQNLVLSILDRAEKEIGFMTQDCKIRIETLAMSGGDFVFTITKLAQESNLDLHIKKKLKVHRKKNSLSSNCLVYKFGNFDDFCNLASFINSSIVYSKLKIAKDIILYLYNDSYFIVFNNISTNFPDIKDFFVAITEFCTYVPNPEIFIYKLQENGKVIFKNNALKKCSNYFK